MTATDGTNVTATDETRRTTEEQQTWAGAVRDVGRTARRHKVVSALIVLCVAGSLTAIGLIGSNSGQAGKPAVVAAPAFSLPALGHSGQQVALSGYRGRPLIVNFFASWCEPCKKETPLIARFYRNSRGNPAILGVDVNDSSAKAMSFVRKSGVTYPVVADPAPMQAAIAYNLPGLPATFFLNSRHVIVKRVYGPVTQAELTSGAALMAGRAG